MDCPGLYDTVNSQEEIATTIVQAVACMHPGPHAILYVIRLDCRYTAEEYGFYNRLKALFDDRVVDFIIFIFRGGDYLERSGTSFADFIKAAPKELVKVFSECNNRCIIFNNIAKNTKPQVEQLLEMVRKMKKEHKFLPYMCPKYSMIGEGVKKKVQKRLEEVQRKDLEREKYVHELKETHKEILINLEETRKQFERKYEQNECRVKWLTQSILELDAELREQQEMKKLLQVSLEKQKYYETLRLLQTKQTLEEEKVRRLEAQKMKLEEEMIRLKEEMIRLKEEMIRLKEEKMETWLEAEKMEMRQDRLIAPVGHGELGQPCLLEADIPSEYFI